MSGEWRVMEDARALSAGLAAEVVRAAKAALAERRRFALAVSGGSALDRLAEGLQGLGKTGAGDFQGWHVFWADERCVPSDHADSNARGAREAWLDGSGFGAEQVHAVDGALPPEEGAADYERRLRAFFGGGAEALPVFDFVLLGMGEDGHTASLFPGHAEVEEEARWVVGVRGSPKPPPERVSLTLPVLNAARVAAVVATGAGKAPVVREVFAGTGGAYPIARVRPVAGRLVWFLDQAAAGG